MKAASSSLLGILGGGQLGWMLAIAAKRLGHQCRAWDLSPSSPTAREAELIVGKLSDPETIRRFRKDLTVATYEWENVPVSAVEALIAQGVQVLPPVEALRTAQDRLDQKQRLNEIGVPTAPFFPVSSEADLQLGLKKLGYPALLKTRREGYDGKGQVVIRTEGDAMGAFQRIGLVPAILEGWVQFDSELSIVSVRGSDGTMKFYPISRNVHRDGILRTTWIPAEPKAQAEAERIAKLALERFTTEAPYIGVMTLELFSVGGKLLVNEVATRVHNTGHWTIEGAKTSQFENHVRAILGMELGDTSAHGPTAMVNLIGRHPSVETMSKVRGATVHLYGKEARPGRKLGHVTILAQDEVELRTRVDQMIGIIGH